MLFGVYCTNIPSLSLDPKQEIISWALFGFCIFYVNINFVPSKGLSSRFLDAHP